MIVEWYTFVVLAREVGGWPRKLGTGHMSGFHSYCETNMETHIPVLNIENYMG
jgi:hypothetical protein